MSESEEKKHPASQQKLRKKRKEGSVPQATSSVGALSAAALLIILLSLTASLFHSAVTLLELPALLISDHIEDTIQMAFVLVWQQMLKVLLPLILATLFIAIVGSLVFNGGIVFAMKPVVPDLKKVSMTSGFKRVLGKRGWIETGQTFVMLATWLCFATFVMSLHLPNLFISSECSSACQRSITFPLFISLILGAIFWFLLSAGWNLVIQRGLFQHEQRMTETEVKRERKDQHGSPEMRKYRNIARHEVMSSPGTRFSHHDATIAFVSNIGVVAINFDPPQQGLPRLVAKARDQDKMDTLLLALKASGTPIFESYDLVANGLRKSKSDVFDVQHFPEFARYYAIQLKSKGLGGPL
ncbi:EscU/YscU/HrcU family type III secretion system export apparatus switch protein [Parasedimentitalea maritima]|uniref:EscU/YscU/HrcU family type III secretion system export apparatus switch protein n=1 Tax=Parasedimentitalea maritima TaxID=2578117 RepID=A0ABY2USE0_9RHOB|nr:EscU/YscU/HrcU family type III secretion system export apparatus switch protein [Zongyanglinia marina]TLP55321.1 EscU/YscU/HrcU family type III secretion system export apparatus switch protein [Zongyanglinia marina]